MDILGALIGIYICYRLIKHGVKEIRELD